MINCCRNHPLIVPVYQPIYAIVKGDSSEFGHKYVCPRSYLKLIYIVDAIAFYSGTEPYFGLSQRAQPISFENFVQLTDTET